MSEKFYFQLLHFGNLLGKFICNSIPWKKFVYFCVCVCWGGGLCWPSRFFSLCLCTTNCILPVSDVMVILIVKIHGRFSQPDNSNIWVLSSANIVASSETHHQFRSTVLRKLLLDSLWSIAGTQHTVHWLSFKLNAAEITLRLVKCFDIRSVVLSVYID